MTLRQRLQKQGMGFPQRSEGEYSCSDQTHGPETMEAEANRVVSIIQKRKAHIQEPRDKEAVGTSMVSPLQQLLLRHTS